MAREIRCIAAVGKTTFEIAVPAPDGYSTDMVDDMRRQAVAGVTDLLPVAPDEDDDDEDDREELGFADVIVQEHE